MNVIIADSTLKRLRGLFGRKGFSGVLLLMKCNDVHTYGMRAPIDIAFLRDDGMVVRSFRNVGPWCRLCCKEAACTLERFSRDGPWPEAGDRVDLKNFVVTALEGGQSYEGLSGLQGGRVR